MAHPDDQLPLGGEEPPGGSMGSLEDDERAMKKGKGRMIAGMAIAGLAAVVAIVLYLASGGDEAYSSFGKKVNGRDQQFYDAFWGCVLQGYDLDRIRSDQDLRNQLNLRARNGRSQFGAMVRDECLPKLSELEPALASINPPEGMADPLRGLTDAVGELRGAWSDYIAYLDGLGDEPYGQDAASEHVGRIAKAWYDYSVALSELNKELKEHLQG